MKKINKVSAVALVFAFVFSLTVSIGSVQASCSDSIGSNFNGTAIPAGRYIWFNSHIKLSDSVTSLTTIHFTDQAITFDVDTTPYTLAVPDGDIILDPEATTSTTVYDTASSRWKTTVPADESGNIFIAGLSYPVPASGFPGGINPVTWTGNFSSSINFSANWQWSAAVYTTFSTNYNNLGVKPIDGNNGSLYLNSDHAGTPENFKAYVTGGARGGGGSNFTGSWSGTGSVDCAGSSPEPATINVVKTVVNDNGGTKVIADFPLFVNSTQVTSGATNTFAPGNYIISETNNSNYSETISGDCDASGNVTIVPGDNKFCIITNDDIGTPPPTPPTPPNIDLVKVPSPSALPNGPGQVTYTYTLQNTGTVAVTNITVVDDSCSPLTHISGDTDTDGRLDTNETWTYRCSVTLTQTTTNTATATGWANGISDTDIATATVVVGTPPPPPVAPLIDVVKVPSPSALPNGPGSVTYTYTLSNPGTVPVTDITMVDDICSPLNRISGDTDTDNKLDTNETWTYRCTDTLNQTTTNTVVATGWANGISTTDTASATVVVGNSTPPPLIHVTTVPSPTSLPAGGGMVTYTETITNPGTVALSNVTLNDNKCSPMTYVSGDTDTDSKLDVNESWIYTCQTNITQTTTNTATATGEANNATATDIALATVVVGPPPASPVPPLIDLIKTPTPLALTNGPGSVIYTYTLRNLGTVPATNITVVDNICSPVTFISGDTDIDSMLDVNETWFYSCQMNLTATTTNTAIAVGWANGLSSTDIAIATVVVSNGGSNSVPPPLIHVTTVPSPTSLPAGGGMVTYTETITNPGTVALSNVTLNDNKCSPMTYVSGDTDTDSKLDVNESWIYTCQTNITQTTINTATATGNANNATATDIALATVAVALAPGFPNTGGTVVIPPLIHVTTVPNPPVLVGGGTVTYTQTVTNPGTVALSNVRLTWDVCTTAMTYVSGDTDIDSRLDTNEAWIYTCRAYLTKTTTNTVKAEGDANGFTATDIAIATVVVSVPGLPNTGAPRFPNTGFPPKAGIWSYIIYLLKNL